MQEVETANLECSGCGYKTFSDAKFCSECGHSFSGSEAKETAFSLVRQFASDTTHEVADYGRTALKDPTIKKIAAGAAVGASVAIVIPFVSMGFGAVIGGGILAYKSLLQNDKKK